jgi:hypothetical protein
MNIVGVMIQKIRDINQLWYAKMDFGFNGKQNKPKTEEQKMNQKRKAEKLLDIPTP